MIHAYDEYYLPIVQKLLAELYELAVYEKNMSVDEFTKLFLSSPISKSFEEADPIIVCGKSSCEILGLLLNEPPVISHLGSAVSPEYWVGWVLSYTQWYLNKPYSVIEKAYPSSTLLYDYFPYHEMDITKTVELIQQHIPFNSSLRKFRLQKNLSQSQLANLSGVPLRTIKAYEQNTVNIQNAQVSTLYALSRVLKCTIEDLIIQ